MLRKDEDLICAAPTTGRLIVVNMSSNMRHAECLKPISDKVINEDEKVMDEDNSQTVSSSSSTTSTSSDDSNRERPRMEIPRDTFVIRKNMSMQVSPPTVRRTRGEFWRGNLDSVANGLVTPISRSNNVTLMSRDSTRSQPQSRSFVSPFVSPLNTETHNYSNYHHHSIRRPLQRPQNVEIYNNSPPLCATTSPFIRPRAHPIQTAHSPTSHSHPPSSCHLPLSRSPGSQIRSNPDVLKTLLRKKACLYEAGTSRAIALITWLVGRKLALSGGYFSRQQLQSGVHHVVCPKIDNGVITRTKVNRCMQIILNCCFYYIIPRPDGSVENGFNFRQKFSREQEEGNDSVMRNLPTEWTDLDVLGRLDTWNGEEMNDSPIRSGEERRTVLLCFNENVRSSDDVWRCHNEFIKDAAHSSRIDLTAEEWRIFFSGGAIDEESKGQYSLSSPTTSTAAVVTPVSLPNRREKSMSVDDIFGRMSTKECSKFRTSWCAKRYEHDWTKCGFAHVAVNGGWLRRDPTLYAYSSNLCPFISCDPSIAPLVFNACPMGIKCKHAHSAEEIEYHPQRYKRHNCCQNGLACGLRDVCPHLHVSSAREQDGVSHATPIPIEASAVTPPSNTTAYAQIPSGAPMMYISPSPESDFDRNLGLPGLKALFRRHCLAVHENLRGVAKICVYTHFGDEC